MILDCELRRYAETKSEDARRIGATPHQPRLFGGDAAGQRRFTSAVLAPKQRLGRNAVSNYRVDSPTTFHFYQSQKCLKFHFFALSCSF
jgi:hypothetical protein